MDPEIWVSRKVSLDDKSLESLEDGDVVRSPASSGSRRRRRLRLRRL